MINATAEDRLLTEREVAAILGVCQRTVFTLRKEGKLAHVPVGKAVRYRRSEVERYMRESEIRGETI